MADEFLERLGEVAVGFAWLEEQLVHIIHAYVGTPKAAVFTEHMNFKAKCDTLRKLLRDEPHEQYAAKAKAWLKDCEQVAKARNEALHSKHVVEAGRWRRIEKDVAFEVSVEQLDHVIARITEVYERGQLLAVGIVPERC